jgi:predicted nuclease of predicted toxin-antitoxin system
MKLMVDEGVDAPIVERLRKDGYDVWYVAETHSGITDEEILEKAQNEERLLITQDKDFGGLVYRLGKAHKGLLLVRLHGTRPEMKAELISEAFNKYKEDLVGSFSVIQKDSIRIRRK